MELMKTKDNVGFSTRVNQFVEEIMKHTDVISVETVGDETIIMYEDWEHEPIINTRKVVGIDSRTKGFRLYAEQRAETTRNAAKRRKGLI